MTLLNLCYCHYRECSCFITEVVTYQIYNVVNVGMQGGLRLLHTVMSSKNILARTVTQIRTGHWRSAVFLKRIRKCRDDNCWFCKRPKMTRSHVLLHCTIAQLRAAREEAWEGKDPGGIRVLLNNPRWERRWYRTPSRYH